MLDRRYPHLWHAHDLPRPEHRRLAETIERRVGRGVGVCWDRRTNELWVYLGEPTRGVAQVPLAEMGDADMDEMVAYVQRQLGEAMLDRAEKDRRVDRSKARAEDQKERAWRARCEDERPEMEDVVEHHRSKREMGRHWRGSALINGSKA